MNLGQARITFFLRKSDCLKKAFAILFYIPECIYNVFIYILFFSTVIVKHINKLTSMIYSLLSLMYYRYVFSFYIQIYIYFGQLDIKQK